MTLHTRWTRSLGNNTVAPCPAKSPVLSVSSAKHLIPSISTFNLPPATPQTSKPSPGAAAQCEPPPVFACDETQDESDVLLLLDPIMDRQQGIRPVRLLLERLEAWHQLAKRLYDHFQTLAAVEAQIAKTYRRLEHSIGLEQADQASLQTHFSFEGGVRMVCDAWQTYHALRVKDHAETGNFLRARALPSLVRLKRELKWMIRSVRADDRLTLSTLAKLRQEAAKRLNRLDQQLAYFERHPDHEGSEKQEDPWLVNAAVVKQMVKVYQQENKIHETVLRLQREALHSEEKLIEELRQICQQIYVMRQNSALGLDKGMEDILRIFENVSVDGDWNDFVHQHKHELVSEQAVFRHPDKFHYHNHAHRLLQPVFAARMERKSSVLHHWHEYIYVLTPAGFLHEYKSSKTYPERPDATLFVPHYHVSSDSKSHLHHNLIFELQPTTANAFHGSHASLSREWGASPFLRDRRTIKLRAKSAVDLETWLAHLTACSHKNRYWRRASSITSSSSSSHFQHRPMVDPHTLLLGSPAAGMCMPASETVAIHDPAGATHPVHDPSSLPPPPAKSVLSGLMLYSMDDIQPLTGVARLPIIEDNEGSSVSSGKGIPLEEDSHMPSILTGVACP